MGTGLDLIRRETLAIAAVMVLAVAGSTSVAASESEAPALRGSYRRALRRTGEVVADFPRQSHAGPETFSRWFEMAEPVREHLKRIESRPEFGRWIIEAVERSAPYAYFIRSAIERYGLPPELYYLPVVESHYRIGARSRSGAVGLWQFMKNSVGSWMRINEWLDERRDFWKSTDAAMQKLRHNYMATGDWLLAIAAYNCGLGKLTRTVAASGIRDFWELSRRRLLPKETIDFVPKFLATAIYASHAGRRGYDYGWPEPVIWDRIELAHPVDLRLLAEAAGVSYAGLRVGNMELHYPVTPPDRPNHQLKVPRRYAAAVTTALAAADVHLVKYRIHRVAAGNTLYGLARHFEVPLSLIQRYNPGINPSSLWVGSDLVIPLLKDIGPYQPTPPPVLDPEPDFDGVYVVQAGDTLWGISRAHGTSPAAIARANNMTEADVLRPGMNLKVP